ncbi:PD-(D/E)XK nuclease family protein [Gordonia sp. JH63]|uniref:PD-(D/E)XK nuclease family protein n=1 Tax=Gordonia sp. JH63 TaxID=2698900 RepID=UPI00131F6649|nr:PD-(D/E)XK nuclease family protein [Gordonia sp. JH63]QHD86023.1 PD-(D/E)XK nuclease family protein [Gordonia sp. JH63]
MTRPLGQLTDTVIKAKAGNPLAQVTIVVPNHGSGRDVLHHLARNGGVANTAVLTMPQLVDKLAAPVLSPRLPLPYPLLEAAVQQVLTENPGEFEKVADQPVTARALSAAAWELAAIDQPELETATPMVADLLRVYRTAIPRLAERYFLSHEAYAAATQGLSDAGHLIAYQLNPASSAEKSFIETVKSHGDTIESQSVAEPTQVIHTSDADEEVRAVVRLVRRHLANGIPGHRIGIFYPAEDPYLPLLHEHVTGGDIAYIAPESHTLVDRPIARTLLGLLELDHRTMPRRELLMLLAEGALKRPACNGESISQRRLELLTRRQVPVVGGSDWDRLPGVVPTDAHHDRAVALFEFVKRLQRRLEATVDAQNWAIAAQELTNLLDQYFRQPKSEVDRADLAVIRSECSELALMDSIAPPPSSARVYDALSIRLEGRRGITGTSGAGVAVTPISAGVGRDFDVSIVVGAAEGMVPRPRPENPLLPAELVGTTPREHNQRQLRAFEGAVSAGSAERIVTFPRGNLRGGAEKVPSRWLVPALVRLAGSDVDVVDWQRQTQAIPTIVAVESFDVAAQQGDPRIGSSAASETEWRLRELAAAPANRRRGALDDPIIDLGMHMRSDRLNGRFTRFNGNLGDVRELISTFEKPVSPTGLETWVASPYQFFLEHVLRLKALEDPDEVAQIDALTRGTLVHDILERYVLGTIDGKVLDFARLSLIAQEMLDDATATNPGWLERLWAKDRGIIVRDLADWFEHDRDDLTNGWHPTRVEKPFGTDPEPETTLALGDTMIRFRGKIDRIDTHRDGRVRVTDYKTGKVSKNYNDITADTPTGGGKQFQLPVYGLFARTLGDDVEARYWFITRKGEFKSVGYPVTDSVIATLVADIDLVHRCITAGQFPPKVADTFWELPVIDLLGRAGLRRAWANLENVDQLTDYVQKYGGQV